MVLPKRNIFLLMIALTITGFNIKISIAAAVSGGLDISTNIANNVCQTNACKSTASEIINNMDKSVDPCDNFYKFICGNFIKKTKIPNDEISVESFTRLENKIAQQIRRSLEKPIALNEPQPFKLAKNYYKSCMDTLGIEKRGKESLRKILKTLGGWPVLEGPEWNETDFYWTDLIYKFRKIGYPIDYFFSIHPGLDMKNTTKIVLEFQQPTTILSRDYLIAGINDTTVKAYYKYIIDITVGLGAPRNNAIKKELLDVLEFEIALAEISPSDEELTNITLLHNPMTIAELSTRYPSIPWKKYINNIAAPYFTVDDDEIINVIAPNFIPKFIELISTTPNRVQANYAMWRAVEYSVKYLTEDMLKSQLEFRGKYNGIRKLTTRWKKCVKDSTLLLGTHALYVKKYFNEKAKKRTIEIVTDIRNQVKKILQTIDWMNEETRKNALEKEAAMSFLIGYPDELLNEEKLEELYKNLTHNDDNFLENQLNLTRFELDNEFNELRKPYNKSFWTNYGLVAVVNAFYSPQTNSILLPAGILQSIFFNKNRPKYMNYGAIGSLISHEITHGFDEIGRQLDKDGNLKNWWTTLTNEKFLRKAECIINQYGNYTVTEIGKKLDGNKTTQENIADNGGFKIAYLAYKNWSENHKKEQSLPGLPYNPRQMYWISATTMWCAKNRPEYLADMILTESHSPEEFRIVGSFSNYPEFAKDFNCPLGSRMNPENKCHFW